MAASITVGFRKERLMTPFTSSSTVVFNTRLGSLKQAPAGTWFIYGRSNGPNDPPLFFEGNGNATSLADGRIQIRAALTANEALPTTVSSSELNISWFLGFTPTVGSWTSNADGPDSVNHLYVTRGLSKTAAFETEYDIGCRAADGLSDEAAVLDSIWSVFSSDQVLMADGATTLKYDPSSGRTDGDLLKRHQGECDTWAALLVNTLAIQGIAARRIKVLPTLAFRFIQLKPTSAQGLGANGNFSNPTFDYHYLVQVKDFPTKLYDPSFGGAPATGANLTSLENDYEMRVAGVKADAGQASALTPLSGPPPYHLRYLPESF